MLIAPLIQGASPLGYAVMHPHRARFGVFGPLKIDGTVVPIKIDNL